MANSADPVQLASEEANCSGSTLLAKAGSRSAGQGLSFCYICTKTYLVSTHLSFLTEAIPMSTHKIFFRAKITYFQLLQQLLPLI